MTTTQLHRRIQFPTEPVIGLSAVPGLAFRLLYWPNPAPDYLSHLRKSLAPCVATGGPIFHTNELGRQNGTS